MNPTTSDNAHLHWEQLEAAYNQRDLEAILSLYAESPTFVDYALGQTLTSIDQIRDYVLAQWAPSTKDEVKLINIVESGEWTIARFINSGINDRPFGNRAASDRPFEVHICNVVRWRDGKIVEDHLYYDLYGLLVQLGHAEPLAA